MGVLFTLAADSAWLEEPIEYRDTFTDTVPLHVRLPVLDVCFLSPYGESIAAVCLAARGDAIATFKRTLRFTDLATLGEPLSFAEIVTELPPSLRQHLQARQGHDGVVPPRTWDALVAAVKRLRPAAAEKVDHVVALARDPTPVFRGRVAETLALERDALGLALMAAEIDRSPLLTWREPRQPAPFLRGLTLGAPIEDRLIDYDASVFGAWALVHRDRLGVTMFEEGVNQLTVINVNRTDIEHALGVDLVYYNHRFESFVLVQYKRMRREAGRNVYRPDRSLRRELKRMRTLPVSTAAGSPTDYRLHAGSCYLKLCPEGAFRTRDGELIRGMYLPLDLWDAVVESETQPSVRDGASRSASRTPSAI